MIYPLLYAKPPIKSLSGYRRNWAKSQGLILSGSNRINARNICLSIDRIDQQIRRSYVAMHLNKTVSKAIKRMRKLRKFMCLCLMDEVCTTVDVFNERLHVPVKGVGMTINAWEEVRIPADLNVHTRRDLWRLFDGFRFPPTMISPSRHKFDGQEVFLFGLYRLSHPGKYDRQDIIKIFGFVHKSRASECFYCFLHFMVNQWGYLLTNNMQHSLSHLSEMASSIRKKCSELGCYFDEAFNIFGFIDNTMNATCRPGGGPTRDGIDAPRNDQNIQRAWYNGWKKLHGMKWQTIDLPNGMNFHVYGPVSVRHNDLWTLRHSDINEKLRLLQIHEPIQYRIYGDSAYVHLNKSHMRARHLYQALTPREIFENRVLSCYMEQIEWDYGDIGRYFTQFGW